MKTKNKRAIVLGRHGTVHLVFLIKHARVVKERSTDMYLKCGWKEITPLGHWNGKFHFR